MPDVIDSGRLPSRLPMLLRMGQWRAVTLIAGGSVCLADLLCSLLVWVLAVSHTEWAKVYVTTTVVALVIASVLSWELLDLLFELEHVHGELIETARRDSLTQLFNRGYFLQKLAEEIENAHRRGATLSLLMIDVDHFKSVNDEFGHPVGDRVLQTLASACREFLGPGEVLARFGGEEFAVLLPDLPVPLAFDHAERLRRRISTLRVPVRGGSAVKMTASIGVSTLAPHEDHWGELVDRADRALYRAKREGRNRSAYEPVPSARRD